jgi:hypothetical protein
MFQIMAYAIVIFKKVLYELKMLILKNVKRRVNEIYNKHKSFNLTRREKKSQ